MCLLIMSAMRVYYVILETNVLTTYKENVSRCLPLPPPALIPLNCWLSCRKDKTKSLCGKTNHLCCTFSLPAHLLACFSDLGMFRRQLLHHAKASASNFSDSYALGSGPNSSAPKSSSVMVLQSGLFKMCSKAPPIS